MSAVEKYREGKVYLAEVCGAGTLEDLADAAIADLEAALAERDRDITRMTTLAQLDLTARLGLEKMIRLACDELANADWHTTEEPMDADDWRADLRSRAEDGM